MELCDTIIARKYHGLKLIVQAECVSMARNEKMVAKMAAAGVASVSLGIENVSSKNLSFAGKGDIIWSSKKAIENCHKYGMLVQGLIINGFPEDDEDSIRETYEFLDSLHCDLMHGQILNPYPKTKIRKQLIEMDLIVNQTAYKKYNGFWANVRTKHLDEEQLHYQDWYHRQVILKDWKPSPLLKNLENRFLYTMVKFFFKPLMKIPRQRIFDKYGWRGLYQKDVERYERLNHFEDLEEFAP